MQDLDGIEEKGVGLRRWPCCIASNGGANGVRLF
jgi:hypothetical protein